MAGSACSTYSQDTETHPGDYHRTKGRCSGTGPDLLRALELPRKYHSRLCAVSACVRSPQRGRRLRARDLLGQPPYLARKLQGESSMAVTQESVKVCSVVDLQALCLWLSLDWLNPSLQRRKLTPAAAYLMR